MKVISSTIICLCLLFGEFDICFLIFRSGLLELVTYNSVCNDLPDTCDSRGSFRRLDERCLKIA